MISPNACRKAILKAELNPRRATISKLLPHLSKRQRKEILKELYSRDYMTASIFIEPFFRIVCEVEI